MPTGCEKLKLEIIRGQNGCRENYFSHGMCYQQVSWAQSCDMFKTKTMLFYKKCCRSAGKSLVGIPHLTLLGITWESCWSPVFVKVIFRL